MAALLLAAAPPSAAASPPAAPAPITSAVLQGIDKTTARVTKFEAPLGKPVHFGTLDIVVRDCREHPPEETPESAAFLDIDETLPGDTTPKHLFSGWMFASSPALSALEHPVYDVWVLACSRSTGSTSSTR
jgi:hypothetical protein